PNFTVEQLRKWNDLYYRYEADVAFRDELTRRYFSADWQKHYSEVVDAQRKRAAQSEGRSGQSADAAADHILDPSLAVSALLVLFVLCLFVSFRSPKLYGRN